MTLVQTVELPEVKIKQALVGLASRSIRFEGEYQDGLLTKHFDNRFLVSDLAVYFGYEATDLIPDDATFQLTKPICILYAKYLRTDFGSVDTGVLEVEFQIAVNYADQGLLKLRGYHSLLQHILNPRRKKGLWLPYGLAIRKIEEGVLHNGAEIYASLQNRLLVQSLIATFTTVGDDE